MQGWTPPNFVGDPTLIVGYRTSGRRFEAGRVETKGTVLAQLAAIRTAARQQLSDAQADNVIRPYEVTAALSDNELFVMPADELVRPPSATQADSDGRGEGEQEMAALVALAQLAMTAVAPTTARRVADEDKGLAFYAIATADDSSERWLLVKKGSGRQPLKPGRFWYGLDGDTFSDLGSPVFVLDSDVDLVIGPREVFILNSAAFTTLFADVRLVQARAWLGKHHGNLGVAGCGVRGLA